MGGAAGTWVRPLSYITTTNSNDESVILKMVFYYSDRKIFHKNYYIKNVLQNKGA